MFNLSLFYSILSHSIYLLSYNQSPDLFNWNNDDQQYHNSLYLWYFDSRRTFDQHLCALGGNFYRLRLLIYQKQSQNISKHTIICIQIRNALQQCRYLIINESGAFPNYKTKNSNRKMDIMYYFRTTNKGIYLMKDLPATSSLSRSFFGYSLGLEVMFMIVFVGVFGLSIYRSVKKIKNPKFSLEKQSSEDQEQQNNENENENQNDTNAKQTNDNLIYRFDEEDHEKEKKPDNDDDAKNEEAPEEEAESVDDYDKEHDENEQRFLEIDNQLTFLMPFLVGHVVCNNIFATNIISLVLMAATVVLYMIFNVKGACAQNKWLSLLFMLPALSSFIPVFINDHSMSTD